MEGVPRGEVMGCVSQGLMGQTGCTPSASDGNREREPWRKYVSRNNGRGWWVGAHAATTDELWLRSEEQMRAQVAGTMDAVE